MPFHSITKNMPNSPVLTEYAQVLSSGGCLEMQLNSERTDKGRSGMKSDQVSCLLRRHTEINIRIRLWLQAIIKTKYFAGHLQRQTTIIPQNLLKTTYL